MHTSTHAPPAPSHGDAAAAGRIGPNAVTRLAQALEVDPALRIAVFRRAGCLRHLAAPPAAMVDEDDVTALHEALQAVAGPARAAAMSREAGQLTGDYLLANRIPRLAQLVLRILPRPLAARILVKAIARHAWTFAGSGRFTYAFQPHLVMTLQGSPVARGVETEHPACDYYAATFERVFGAMLGKRTRVRETACSACGDPACRFELRCD